jgi:hypothetical protein
MSDEGKNVEIEVVKPITLEESFDAVFHKLERLQQEMANSDTAVYRAVGEFVDSTVTVAQNMVNVALDSEDSNTQSVVPESAMPEGDFREALCKRFEVIRSQADQLLLTADSNEAIERALKLEQLLDRITNRINSLISTEDDKKPITISKDLSVTQLREMAKERNLKGYSKLKKDELIKELSKQNE